MIEGGVTTVANHYFAIDQVAQAIATSGLRGELAWTMFGQGDGRSANSCRPPICRAVAWCRGRAHPPVWLGPHAPYTCSPDFAAWLRLQAKQLGLGCHIHVSETAGQVEASRRSTVSHQSGCLSGSGCWTGMRCAPTRGRMPDARGYCAAGGRGAGVAHSPKTFLKLAAGIAPVVAMRERGLAVGLGSDGRQQQYAGYLGTDAPGGDAAETRARRCACADNPGGPVNGDV